MVYTEARVEKSPNKKHKKIIKGRLILIHANLRLKEEIQEKKSDKVKYLRRRL